MTVEQLIIAFIAAMGIPSALSGIFFKQLEKRIERREIKREARRDEREKNTEKMILLIAQNSRATYTVAEATAKAVQRIPEAHCNGDMTTALEQAKRFQMEEQQFLIDQGVKRIFGE